MIMVEDKQFRQLERRTYLLYYQDGLVDIIIGLCVIGFAVNMLTDSSALSILAWMPVILLPGLKNRITVPRLGFARFDPKRTGSLRLLTMMLILGLVGAAGRGGSLSIWAPGVTPRTFVPGCGPTTCRRWRASPPWSCCSPAG